MRSKVSSSKLSFSALCISLLSLSACNDDDNSDKTAPAIAYPVMMSFHGVTNESLRLWVGGHEVSTANLEAEDLLNDLALENVIERNLSYPNTRFKFTADTLGMYFDLDGDSIVYPYYFADDTLYIAAGYLGSYIDSEITGSLSELKFAEGFFHYCRLEENNTPCNTGENSVEITIDEVLEKAELSSFSDMAPGDSIVLYNRTISFRP